MKTYTLIVLAMFLIAISNISTAAHFSQTVNVGKKTWLQPTLTDRADSIDGGGWNLATKHDLYDLFRHYFGNGRYTGEKITSGPSEAFGAYYFSFIGFRYDFFDDFEPQITREVHPGSGIFDYALYAKTTDTIGMVTIDYMYQVAYIGDFAGGRSTQLEWLYKVRPVPIPAAALMFCPVVFVLAYFRHKVKN